MKPASCLCLPMRCFEKQVSSLVLKGQSKHWCAIRWRFNEALPCIRAVVGLAFEEYGVVQCVEQVPSTLSLKAEVPHHKSLRLYHKGGWQNKMKKLCLQSSTFEALWGTYDHRLLKHSPCWTFLPRNNWQPFVTWCLKSVPVDAYKQWRI